MTKSIREISTDKRKSDFRRQALRVRNQIACRKEKSEEIADHVLRARWFETAETVFAYLSYRSEVETMTIVGEALRYGKRVAVPKVEGSRMQFYAIFSENDIREGYRGILEPVSCGAAVTPKDDDLILVPGVAFDRLGYRMGYGGGFYDRYLSENRAMYKTVGLAFSEQICERIPTDEYDIRLDMIITEKGAVRYEDNIADRW